MLPVGSSPPLVAGATTFLHGKASHTILRSLALPYESCSLATPQAGAQQPALDIEQFLRLLFNEALLSHRSAGGRWCRKAPKGGEPPEAAKHRDAILADESKSIAPESARSWKLIAVASTCSGTFPPTGIYYRLPQMCCVPRFFAGAQNDCEGGKVSVEQTSPSGGSGAQRQKGCISSAPQARLFGFRCLWQRCRRRRQYTHRPQGDTTTL